MSDLRPRIRQGPIAPRGMPNHAYMITMNPVTVIFLSPKRRFSHLRLALNQEKSRLTTVEEGFAFLGFEFRKPPRRLLYMWPRKKACQHIRDRVREVVRSFPSSASIGEVIRKLNPILNGWCTYFPGRQQQPDLSPDRLGRAERAAIM